MIVKSRKGSKGRKKGGKKSSKGSRKSNRKNKEKKSVAVDLEKSTVGTVPATEDIHADDPLSQSFEGMQPAEDTE